MDNLIPILVFIFGSIVGSFLNVVILRLPKEKKINGRSICPSCGHKLKPWELVPILSFFLLGRKCSKCKKGISWRYPIIEAVTGGVFVLFWYFFGGFSFLFAINLIKFWVIACALIVVFVVDLENYIILDRVLAVSFIIILALGLLAGFLSKDNSLINFGSKTLLGAFLVPIPFFLLWYLSKGNWLGFGDVKLAVWLGAVFGLAQGFLVVFLGIIIGGAVSMVLILAANKTLKSRVPFGIFLSFAGITALFLGEKLLHWYLALLGF